MTLHIAFSCDNSAFDPDPRPEIILTLKKLIMNLEVLENFPIPIFDSNGNRIGGCNLVLDDEEGRRNG
jgi:hypothetical protein